MKHSKKQRNDFIAKVKEVLKKAVEEKSINAYFFNWADYEEKEKKEAEDTLNNLLPGKWRFVHLWGNGTDVGEGWFCEDEYEIYVKLTHLNEDDDDDPIDSAIDSFEVFTGEEIDDNYNDRKNIENKGCSQNEVGIY